MHNIRYAKDLEPFDRARVAVLGFVGPDGTPRACAVTPYVIDGDLVITSTLAYLAKVRAITRRPDTAAYVDGAHASACATVDLHVSPAWFDAHLREQERRKYPPARLLLALPFHRRLLWWYVGRAVVTLPQPRLADVQGSSRVSITTVVDGHPQIRPLGSVEVTSDVVDLGAGVPDGPACLLVHDEDDSMDELLQLTLRGQVVDGRLHVARRSGSLVPTHPGTVDQVRSLRALGRAAAANRAEITNWTRGTGNA